MDKCGSETNHCSCNIRYLYFNLVYMLLLIQWNLSIRDTLSDHMMCPD